MSFSRQPIRGLVYGRRRLPERDAVARRKKPEAEEFTEEDMLVQLTPNQIVAYNLAQARMWKNWTQEEAAEHLAPYLGAKWSKASFSAAERSVDGQRVRQFSADEIVAFSRGFGLPVGFFFLPPPRGAAADADPSRRARQPDVGHPACRADRRRVRRARARSGSWACGSRSSSARSRSSCRPMAQRRLTIAHRGGRRRDRQARPRSLRARGGRC